jgi:hypothetical protein
MTRLTHLLITTLALAVLSLAFPTTSLAKGRPIVPDQAIPAVELQGADIQGMLIKGRNLPADAAVIFIYNNVENPDDPRNGNDSQITADPESVQLLPNGDLQLDVSVTAEAFIGGYDIEVIELSSGRKGKGTTLFKIQGKNTDERLTCAPFVKNPANCSCEFYKREETNDSGTPPLSIYGLIDNCTTSETLVIPQFHQLQSFSPDGGDDFRRTITAVNGAGGAFDGSTIIAAEGHRARLLYIDLDVDDGVDTGCGGNLESAVRFVLDEDSKNPTDPDPDPNYPRTRWLIGSLEIASGAALCYGIEAIRTAGYPHTGAPESMAEITGSWLKPGSWVRTGIRLVGFDWWSQSLRVPEISSNVIEAQASGVGDAATAIEIGPVSLDGSGVIDAVVAENVINMAGAGTGIAVYGGPEMGAMISKNTVSGARYGVLIDGNLVDANVAGNTLTGDNAAGTGDKAVCTDTLDTAERGKPNRISQYDAGYNEVVFGCYP